MDANRRLFGNGGYARIGLKAIRERSARCRTFAAWVSWLLLALTPPALARGEPNELRWVDPFMGTGSGAPDFGIRGGSGSTFPGAVLPFGMSQFSPDTIPSRTNFSGGYSYGDRQIRGFSLTHFSGAGCAIYRDVPILPTTARVDVSPAVGGSSDIDPSYVPRFDHRHETASPGAYRVLLNPGSRARIDSQLTVTPRTADARFTFPAQRRASVLINAGGSSKADYAASVRVDTRRQEVMGSAESGHFCSQPTKYRVYFVARFNRAFAASGTWQDQTLNRGAVSAAGSSPNAYNLPSIPGDPSSGVRVGAYVSFDTRVARSVEMEVGVSFTSISEARKNLDAEVGRRSFESLRSAAENAWRTELAKVIVSGGSSTERSLFYTSLYHALIEPSTFSDADGSYVGMEGRVHHGRAVTQYTNISGWDVYRSQTPLMAILEPRRAADLATSIVRDARQSGCLPRWPYADQQTNVQVGDPSDPMLAGIYAFGARGFDVRSAMSRMIAGATARCHTHNGDYTEREGLPDYLRLGYVPHDLNTDVTRHALSERDHAWGAAATTLEYAIADSSIASLAASLGERTAAHEFRRRAENWSHLFDRASGYIRPRYRSGQWLASYDPTSMTGFVEGDGAQYTWLVPQDPAGLFRRMGGEAKAALRLDRFFRKLNAGPSASYAYLGDEPTLGVPWLYDWLGRPASATEVVRRALLGLYAPTPNGMPGNDDGGTMSAWWVLGAIGLYPAVPGADLLALNGPLFPHATISLPSGRLTIDAEGLSNRRRYVQSARLDGKPLDRSWLNFKSIRRGRHRLLLRMGASSRSKWATLRLSRPPSM
jgi:predicted alpha-1,2-mannosidase